MTLPAHRPILCLVTDRRRLAGPHDPQGIDSLLRLVGQAARAGVDLIQVRERDLPAGSLVRLVLRCLEVVRGTPASVLVNDRVDVALAVGAAGVHLRADSMAAERVRDIAPPVFLVGRSIHGAAEAEAVGATGAVDYLMLGTVFPSPSKATGASMLGVGELAEAVRRSRVPVLAIGGVTPDRASVVARSGAAGIAAIGLFLGSGEPTRPGDNLERIVDRVRRAFGPPGSGG